MDSRFPARLWAGNTLSQVTNAAAPAFFAASADQTPLSPASAASFFTGSPPAKDPLTSFQLDGLPSMTPIIRAFIRITYAIVSQNQNGRIY